VAKTRDRILDAALELFAENGFEGTPITAVERRVGLTAGTGSFYRHFRSKEDLLRAAIEHEVDRIMAEIHEARSEPELEPDLTAALRDIRRFDRLFRIAMIDGDKVPELREAMTTALQGPRQELSWADDPTTVVAIAAVGGYHLLSLMQGRPFQDAPQDEFLAALRALVELG
jgi:AcrR family transcriptional regulator